MSLNNFGQFVAGGTIGPSRFVVQDATADNRAVEASSTIVPILGISQVGMKRTPGLAGSDVAVAAQTGDLIEIYALGDVAPLQLAGTVTRGDMVSANGATDGRGITQARTITSFPAGGLPEIGGRALQSGTANQLILVQVLCRTF